MLSRIGWFAEVCVKFHLRPLAFVCHDGPMLFWAWLWWSGSLWLVPHTRREQAQILSKMSGCTVIEAYQTLGDRHA